MHFWLPALCSLVTRARAWRASLVGRARSRNRWSWRTRLLQQTAELTPIRTAAEALDVFDFEPVAQRRIPIAHWGYLAGGVDDQNVGLPDRLLVAWWTGVMSTPR